MQLRGIKNGVLVFQVRYGIDVADVSEDGEDARWVYINQAKVE